MLVLLNPEIAGALNAAMESELKLATCADVNAPN